MTPLSYPPTNIKTNDGVVNILQLTDTHLYLDPTTEVAGINNQNSFEACLKQGLKDNKRCDLIVLTGDLVNEVVPKIYDRIYETLSQTGIPFAWVAGNHDVTDELVPNGDYSKKKLVAHKPDSRLLSKHCIHANDWKILLIDSSIPGQVYGRLGEENLTWMRQNIQNSHNPVIITMHHHLLSMNSAWIDKHITQDADAFWKVAEQLPNIKAVISGHVHQYQELMRNGIHVYSTPSTCYQFKPAKDEFEIDKNAKPGYRWLTLLPNGAHESYITRIKN